LLLLFGACKQSYEPLAIKAPNRFLVVEGAINANAGARTTILLSRTRNLLDTFLTDPERNARVQIQDAIGVVINLNEQAAGRYVSPPLSLNTGQSYRLKILTSDGKEYLSDLVPVKITPPIDSITWKQDNDVTIYANTHDPSNNTRYYRWDFTETWQYNAVYETDLGVSNGLIFYTDSTNQTYNCWKTAEARDISLASSIKLSQDVIDHAPVTTIQQTSEKIAVRYSILVRQYALTPEAYQYWEILQKNTQRLGTFFDAQPSQLKRNIHCTSNPNEPVIGYASASTIPEKRIFIKRTEVTGWTGGVPQTDCFVIFTAQDPVNYLIYHYSDTAYGPYYFTSGGGIALSKKNCLDCRRIGGGSNQKPSFW
jgi:hypothetical protein